MYTVQIFTCGRWHTYDRYFSRLEASSSGHDVPDSAEAFGDAALHTGADIMRVFSGKVVVMENTNHGRRE